ncbi:hypothetical protein M0P65_00310 [Candidatus Gracilibacteria bacterium]|nr:hypothetical protein [Candidatus Gracilibacteria bacterium]
MSIINTNEYTIVKKHFIYFLLYIIRFIFSLLIALGIFYLTITYRSSMGPDFTLILFGIIFIILNYSFLRFIIGLIIYYNDLIILLKDKIIILKSSFFLKDDLEIIDISKVMKIDVQIHGFLSNLMGFGNLIIEQQRDELRVLHFIPTPYKVYQLLREKNSLPATTQNDLNFFKIK